MAQKVNAFFLICIVVLATVNVMVEAQGPAAQAYKTCIEDCEEKCKAEGGGSTYCEMKCDEDCSAEELKAKLESLTKRG